VPEKPVGRLSAAAAYRLWAPTYDAETVISALEDRLVREGSPSVESRRLLDVGCGTGRRLRAVCGSPACSVGVDLVSAMLLATPRAENALRIAGDANCLPLRSASFDLLWCRLVLGHLRDLQPVYSELARVSRSGADLIVSDFHAAAWAAGHRRTFRDSSGGIREIESYAHSLQDHSLAAGSQGWSLVSVAEAPAGPAERPFYERADRRDQFDRERDLPLVFVLGFRR